MLLLRVVPSSTQHCVLTQVERAWVAEVTAAHEARRLREVDAAAVGDTAGCNSCSRIALKVMLGNGPLGHTAATAPAAAAALLSLLQLQDRRSLLLLPTQVAMLLLHGWRVTMWMVMVVVMVCPSIDAQVLLEEKLGGHRALAVALLGIVRLEGGPTCGNMLGVRSSTKSERHARSVDPGHTATSMCGS